MSPGRQTLYVVGELRAQTAAGWVWDFHGVFDSPSHAEQQCVLPTMFVGPIELNEDVPLERQDEWPGAYFPRFLAEAH